MSRNELGKHEGQREKNTSVEKKKNSMGRDECLAYLNK